DLPAQTKCWGICPTALMQAVGRATAERRKPSGDIASAQIAYGDRRQMGYLIPRLTPGGSGNGAHACLDHSDFEFRFRASNFGFSTRRGLAWTPLVVLRRFAFTQFEQPLADVLLMAAIGGMVVLHEQREIILVDVAPFVIVGVLVPFAMPQA